jgi:hypothetical protein
MFVALHDIIVLQVIVIHRRLKGCADYKLTPNKKTCDWTDGEYYVMLK